MRRHLLALLVAVVVAGCGWPQLHGGADRTGFQPLESKIGASTVASLSEAWTATFPGAMSSPVVAGGSVYVGVASQLGGRGDLLAFDAAGTTSCSGSPTRCGPLWSGSTIGGVHTTPAVVNGVAYVVDDLGGLSTFDAAGPDHCAGAPGCPLLWGGDPGFGGGGSPAVSGGVLYIGANTGSGTGRLSAYDAAGTTGCSGAPRFCSPLWTASPDGPILASVAVSGGKVFAISEHGTLYAFDAAGQTGCAGTPKVCSPLWTAAAPSSTTTAYSSPVVGGGVVYTMDSSRLLRAFDTAGVTGCSGTPRACAPLWTAQVLAPDPGDPSSDSPALANGLVYAANAVYDARGVTSCAGTPKVCAPLWRVDGGGRLPVIANGIEIVGGAAPSGGGPALPLQAFDATGTSGCSGTPRVCAPRWSVDAGGRILGSPAIADGVLYVVTADDPGSTTSSTLHAYRPDPGPSAARR
jgi:hypothetical protein